MKCEFCDREIAPKGIGSHMRTHKAEIEEIRNAVQEVKKASIPKWRKQTPVFGPGQCGVRIPNHRLERGVK